MTYSLIDKMALVNILAYFLLFSLKKNSDPTLNPIWFLACNLTCYYAHSCGKCLEIIVIPSLTVLCYCPV